MARKKSIPPPKPMWAYAYELVPPQAEERLRSIKPVLDKEHSEARRGARTWVSNVVLERQVTHILVVSDSPAQNREVNRQLEATLRELKAGFSVTAPMLVADEVTPMEGGAPQQRRI
jgi:hypothetical protein